MSRMKLYLLIFGILAILDAASCWASLPILAEDYSVFVYPLETMYPYFGIALARTGMLFPVIGLALEARKNAFRAQGALLLIVAYLLVSGFWVEWVCEFGG